MKTHSATLVLSWYPAGLFPNAIPALAEGTGQAFPAMKVKPFKVLVWSALVVTVAAVALILYDPPRPSTVKILEGRPALVQAFGPLRPVQGRLTGGFDHHVYDPAGKAPKIGSLPKDQALSTPQELADHGVLVLFDEKWDEAIASLEEAAARAPGDPSIFTDLAAAYLERGARMDRSLDGFLALAAAERAVERAAAAGTGSPLPEALFNQALALERLSLAAQARKAWKRYLDVETDTAWLAEGAEHLERLERSSAPRTPIDRPALEAAAESGDTEALRAAVDPLRFPLRRLGEEELLPEWARAYRAGDPEAAERSLGLARALGDALVTLSQDKLLRDAVAAIDEATPDQLDALARGHLEYRAGRDSYAAAELPRADDQLRASRRALARGGSPFALRAEFAIGVCEHALSKRSAALHRFTTVAAQAADRSYLSLLGESLWMEGLSRSADKEIPPALAAYERALSIFEDIKETENIAGVHILFAEVADDEGTVEEGWQHRLTALRETLAIGDPQRLYQVYIGTMVAATRQGQHRVALYFQEEALRNARLAKSPIAIAEAMLWRSRSHQRLGPGERERAGEDLRNARAALAGVPPSPARDRTEADICLAEAELVAERPESAIPLLTQALHLYGQDGPRDNRIEILQSRARAYQAQGDLVKAEEDLEFAARSIEAWRSRIEDPKERVSFLARSEQLFDALIRLHLDGRKDPGRAFDTLERQRARVLLDAVLPAVQPLTAKEVAERLPAGTVVVSYALLDDQLAAFVIDRGGVRVAKIISKEWPSIESQIAAYRAGASGHAGARELDREARNLYGALIAPLAEALPVDARLILSCDESLQRLPFAALRNPGTGRYLVQDHTLTMAPSASVYLAGVERFRRIAQEAPRSMLLVSNPEIDRSRHPGLPQLPGTANEARDAAALYPKVALLNGRAATARTFLRKAPDFDIVHFLGHAIRMSSARGSCLVLAPETGVPDGDLFCGREIERLRLDRTRLVILSACGTADGYIARSEGIASLARSFLAAGAPAVIGTSWNVKDRTAYLFLSDLHGDLSRGIEPAEALRNTQLRCIGSSDRERQSPRFWANFQLTGGTH